MSKEKLSIFENAILHDNEKECEFFDNNQIREAVAIFNNYNKNLHY